MSEKHHRRLLRELAFKSIYQMEFQDLLPSEAVRNVCEMEEIDGVYEKEVERLAFNIISKKNEIDKTIKNYIVGWTLERLPLVSKDILRLGVYELLFEDSIPIEVSIDEAVEIAKKFGTDGDRKFINGVLDRIAKELANKEKISLMKKNLKKEEEEKMNAKMNTMKPITEIGKMIGIEPDQLIPYGKYMAKIPHQLIKDFESKKNGKLIIVTAITPTPAGEGKTTTSIGLSLGLNRIGKKAIVTLREPSLGPVFGVKGGATGGGKAQVLPMEEINLHFTGDIHAVSAAHNLLAAMIDAHIHNGNELNIDVRKVRWPRTIDMNDRALRNVVVALGGSSNGFPRETGYVITAASEVMAILCLAENVNDLKERLSKIIIGETVDGKYVTAGDLHAQGAMTALLKDALNPNLVQTTENTPVIVHGGPFANIAHGTNSIIATKLALKLADYVITETGFAADLGAEKFFDVVSKYADLKPDTVVLVASVRALKMHGGEDKKNLKNENLEALRKGMENLKVHIENIKKFGLPVVVAINKFPTDSSTEIKTVEEEVKKMGVRFALSEGFEKGGEGTELLAKTVIESIEKDKNDFHRLYDWNLPVKEKIETLAREIYRAGRVEYSADALSDIKKIEKTGYGHLPIIMAKTQSSLSDDPKVIGAPSGYTFTIREVKLSAGAGFIVPISGEIMTMPGLPKEPAAINIDVDEDGNITGLF
ncbi:formate--tetrahydrofolate ligase [Athalassotoga saccharophila]|nr:formate--tetrahydrofolate ligase [Athalassotoga saccharophila]BBJ28064.1 formate--tetrahydrofolate ligase [Athalassotoga saccharophila]